MDEVKIVSPLRLRITEPAEDQLASALSYLTDNVGLDAAERLNTRLKVELPLLCEQIAREIATVGVPFHAPDEQASLYFARPVYRLKLETSKTRARRSSTGLWYVYYGLKDSTGQGTKPDTLSVVAIRHSGAPPLSVENTD